MVRAIWPPSIRTIFLNSTKFCVTVSYIPQVKYFRLSKFSYYRFYHTCLPLLYSFNYPSTVPLSKSNVTSIWDKEIPVYSLSKHTWNALFRSAIPHLTHWWCCLDQSAYKSPAGWLPNHPQNIRCMSFANPIVIYSTRGVITAFALRISVFGESTPPSVHSSCPHWLHSPLLISFIRTDRRKLFCLIVVAKQYQKMACSETVPSFCGCLPYISPTGKGWLQSIPPYTDSFKTTLKEAEVRWSAVNRWHRGNLLGKFNSQRKSHYPENRKHTDPLFSIRSRNCWLLTGVRAPARIKIGTHQWVIRILQNTTF